MPPLVVHVMYRFDVGGLENGVANLINEMPSCAYRHAVLSLTDVSNFRSRIGRNDVELISLRKPPGHGVWLYPRLISIFRNLRPAIVHSRNLAALEVQVAAQVAGVPVRIHGEHGRDEDDLHGTNLKYQGVRRFYRPFVNHYVALSSDLALYVENKVKVPRQAISQIFNGVDVSKFSPSGLGPVPIEGCPFDPTLHWLVGTVGRMQFVKNQTLLALSFIQALELAPNLRAHLRLVMAGDGPSRNEVLTLLKEAGMSELAWLPGVRHDIPNFMRGLHAFVLPSLAEGVSNTILEAMASSLPVIATDVGGNSELVSDGETGYIVPSAQKELMAERLVALASDVQFARLMGEAGRERVIRKFSLQAMVDNYQAVYDKLLRVDQAIS